MDGQKVTCLTPSGKISELCVLLDKDTLGAVFSATHKEIDECFAAEKSRTRRKMHRASEGEKMLVEPIQAWHTCFFGISQYRLSACLAHV